MRELTTPTEDFISQIYLIRGQRVMLDADLAAVYNVDTKRLNEQVRRNARRFPEEFVFQLTSEEFDNLKSHFATSSWGGKRKLPFAFTEHGAIMAASVLNSDAALQASIFVVKAFRPVAKRVGNIQGIGTAHRRVGAQHS
ncbi:MAG: ORF6N domain-containing protein [Bacteroidota bacterium]